MTTIEIDSDTYFTSIVHQCCEDAVALRDEVERLKVELADARTKVDQ